MKAHADAMKQHADALAMHERDAAHWKKSKSDTPGGPRAVYSAHSHHHANTHDGKASRTL